MDDVAGEGPGVYGATVVVESREATAFSRSAGYAKKVLEPDGRRGAPDRDRLRRG
jgi:hypothetical protein